MELKKLSLEEVEVHFKELVSAGKLELNKALNLLHTVEEHAHLRRASKHAVAMSLQTGDPKIIEAAKAKHEDEMALVAASPFTPFHVDVAAQAVLDAQGYVAPKES